MKHIHTYERWILVAACALFALCGSLSAQQKHITQSQAVSAATVKPQPEYPAVAKQLRVQGEVSVNVYISEDGSVEKIETISGNPVLVKSVERSLKEWKFNPFHEDGKAVKAIASMSFTFKF